jgi:microcystin-dependent protein
VANQFLGEIRIFPFGFAPNGWASCNGQVLPISQNTALFSLFGTYYGGNGTTTFGLPNLQGASPLHQGQGPGLSPYDIGDTGGSQTVTVLSAQLPPHPHTLQGDGRPGDLNTPSSATVLARSSPSIYKTSAGAATAAMAAQVLGGSGGGSGPHNNLMPYLTLNFCVALQGVYPTRS